MNKVSGLLKLKKSILLKFSYTMRNPFNRSDYPYGNRRKTTPEGEPLEGSGISRSLVRIIVPIIIGIIIISIIAVSSIRMVDAGNRGVFVNFEM